MFQYFKQTFALIKNHILLQMVNKNLSNMISIKLYSLVFLDFASYLVMGTRLINGNENGFALI